MVVSRCLICVVDALDSGSPKLFFTHAYKLLESLGMGMALRIVICTFNRAMPMTELWHDVLAFIMAYFAIAVLALTWQTLRRSASKSNVA